MNKHGINAGVHHPISEQEEFDILHVDIHHEELCKIKRWLLSDEKKSFVITGQPGVGKTTLLNTAFREKKPDINIAIDIETESNYCGYLWYLILKKIIFFSKEEQIKLSDLNISLRDFFKKQVNCESIILDCIDYHDIATEIQRDIIEFKTLLKKIILLVESKINRNITFYIKGIDRFTPKNETYEIVLGILHYMLDFKFICDMNVFQLSAFSKELKKKNAEICLIKSIHTGKIFDIVDKRNGGYGNLHRRASRILAFLSGGNLRQAIKLHEVYMSFDFYKYSFREIIEKTISDTIFSFFTFDNFDNIELFFEKEKIDIKEDVYLLENIYKLHIIISEHYKNYNNNEFTFIINPLLAKDVTNIVFAIEKNFRLF